jgi:hypothetical protein
VANSTFPFRIGTRNGSNAGVVRGLSHNRIPHAFVGPYIWYQKFDITLAGTLDGDGAQEFDMHTYNPANLFPANVQRGVPMIYLSEVFAGGAVDAATVEMGDANDPNGLHTAVNVWTGATLGYFANTVSAAEYAPRFEAAFIPSITIRTTSGFVNALTTGFLWVGIKFSPVAGVS